MKQIIILLLLISSLKTQGQSYSVTVEEVKRTAKINYFKPIVIHLNNDSIVNGYGYLDAFATSYYLNYINIKPTKKSDIYEGNKPLFKEYSVSDLVKVEINDIEETKELYPVSIKGAFNNPVLMKKKHENNSYILFSSINEKLIRDRFIAYVFVNKQEPMGRSILFNLAKKNKSIPTRFFKEFKGCPKLYTKIKNGDFKYSFDDLIKILDFYDINCKDKG